MTPRGSMRSERAPGSGHDRLAVLIETLNTTNRGAVEMTAENRALIMVVDVVVILFVLALSYGLCTRAGMWPCGF